MTLVYTRESYEKELPPGGKINKTTEEFFNNLKGIKEMEKKYQAELENRGIPAGRIKKYGYEFRGKEVLIGAGKQS